ncbi:MAG: Uncharacterised protein [Gammaproteobacteria bacterium]|nr:MAG: Uncharacterised protein [Gammaproteobacteria bacterium]
MMSHSDDSNKYLVAATLSPPLTIIALVCKYNKTASSPTIDGSELFPMS